MTLDGLTDFAKGVGTLVWNYNPLNWSADATSFREKMLTQLTSSLKKMVITDDCYESGKLWGHTIIGIFGAEGLVAVGKGAIKLGELASVSANRIAKISKLSEEGALAKVGKKADRQLVKENKWIDQKGNIIWPKNSGFLNEPRNITLQPGVKIDRYGYDGGSFVSPQGTPYSARSLAPGTESKLYSVFEVLKPISAQTGTAAPWFGHPGGGVQHMLPNSVDNLIKEGFIKKIK